MFRALNNLLIIVGILVPVTSGSTTIMNTNVPKVKITETKNSVQNS
jgi:hypothetical protein